MQQHKRHTAKMVGIDSVCKSSPEMARSVGCRKAEGCEFRARRDCC